MYNFSVPIFMCSNWVFMWYEWISVNMIHCVYSGIITVPSLHVKHVLNVWVSLWYTARFIYCIIKWWQSAHNASVKRDILTVIHVKKSEASGRMLSSWNHQETKSAGSKDTILPTEPGHHSPVQLYRNTRVHFQHILHRRHTSTERTAGDSWPAHTNS